MYRGTAKAVRAATSDSHLTHSDAMSAGKGSSQSSPLDHVRCRVIFARTVNGLDHPSGSYRPANLARIPHLVGWVDGRSTCT
jgi:hypothetical protein